MQSIFRKDFQPPQSLEASGFILFPTDPAFAVPDHQAVMASRETLRIWGGDSWPEDGFTVEQNREDLASHVEDNEAHDAYGYMIFDPSRSRCFGSVYVNPLTDWESRYELVSGDPKDVSRADARIDYWIATTAPEMEQPVLDSLIQWFSEIWKIHPLFTARPLMPERQQRYLDSGLVLKAHLRHPEGWETLLYGSE